jgi:hypothetical protein
MMDTAVRQSHLWTFRRGKAIRFEWSSDPDYAFEAIADTSSGTAWSDRDRAR